MAAVSKDARYPAAIRGRQADIVHRHLCLLYPVLATTRLPSDFSYFFLDFVTSDIRLCLAWESPHLPRPDENCLLQLLLRRPALLVLSWYVATPWSLFCLVSPGWKPEYGSEP